MGNVIETRVFLGALTVERGLATSRQVKECLEIQQRHGRDGVHSRLGELLVKKGYVAKEQVVTLLGEQKRLNGESNIVGKYRLLRPLGKGGMACVYLAQRLSDGCEIALKILHKSTANNSRVVARFRREAQVMLALDHPNIVQAYEVGQENKLHYLAMEYVAGQNLYERIKAVLRLEEREALFICRQVAEGLEYAAQRGVVHRDIKPENILIDQLGRVKVTDLGLAIMAHSNDLRLTQAGMAIGTPLYISPEQARGERNLDSRCDIYALGATFYHMVTGQPPFAGRSAAEVVTQHLTKEIPDPRRINPGISGGTVWIIRKAMSKDRNDRYQTPAAMIEDIDRAIRGLQNSQRQPILPTTPKPAFTANQSVSRRAKRPSRREPTAVRPVARIAQQDAGQQILAPEARAFDPSRNENKNKPSSVQPAVSPDSDACQRLRSSRWGRRSCSFRPQAESLGTAVRAVLIAASLVAASIWLGLIGWPTGSDDTRHAGPRQSPGQRQVVSRQAHPNKAGKHDGPMPVSIVVRETPQTSDAGK